MPKLLTNLKTKDYKLKTNFGFTLIEMIVSITIFWIIIVIAFDTLSNISFLKVRTTNNLDLNKDLYYSVENFASLIKDFDWEIDYDEYFNRKSVWTTTSSGHYTQFSWFGNYGSWWTFGTNVYWDWFYYCLSWNGTNMWSLWCLDNSFNTYSSVVLWSPQRYWQYQYQFIDYNSNLNQDKWDEDWDWNIIWDDDDENIWAWPTAFSWSEMKELYLVKRWPTTERLFFRLNYIKDPDNPSWPCNQNSDWFMSWSGCLWNIQMLRLIWKDLWFSHSWALTSFWKYDWIIDTWQCSTDYNCSWPDNMPAGKDSEWVNILPSYIDVKNIKFYIYPNKDYRLSWKETDSSININPYIRINMTIGFAWKRRKLIKFANPNLNISTTINLNY